MIKNSSGQEIILLIIYYDNEQEFKIENGDSFLLPNLTENKALSSVKVIGENNEPASFTRNEVVGFLKKKHRVFVVNKGLSIRPEKYK